MDASVPNDPGDPADLVKGAACGDSSSWNVLVTRFSGLIWAVTGGFGLAHDDRSDVCQTTWLKLAEQLDRIEHPERIGGWLATTARREAIRLARARQRVTPTADAFVFDLSPDERSPERLLLEAEQVHLDAARMRRLLRAFEQLSVRCRRLLRVQLASPPPSYAEVAAGLDMPIGSIGPTRARCLKTLRAKLTPDSYDEQA
ncbi:sigma-70 family RNA polymerase sigma factor [Acrocarpospora macrocephala]|uniref:RNA polymerase sigma factor n=1 Tax=Acrocarpospora macrocephala TaxID=150177 RepID=A0A5M3X742_9ACTN|nr:sigma-70 family RNA polymerase sigma factor [Acrocarpospora macrocephala]GES16914.1 RNA polymerase sigma factor [Acrocarpospora macrocephala]